MHDWQFAAARRLPAGAKLRNSYPLFIAVANENESIEFTSMPSAKPYGALSVLKVTAAAQPKQADVQFQHSIRTVNARAAAATSSRLRFTFEGAVT